MSNPQISIIIPTRNGSETLPLLLESIKKQTIKPLEVIVVDSNSMDSTKNISKKFGCRIINIRKKDFNHGRTRNLGVTSAKGDIVVFMTQDAILNNKLALEKLTYIFTKNNKISAICGRQLPLTDATPIAAHARIFNYPPKTLVKTKDDIKKFGIKTAFMSNSFAAYKKSILTDLNGFPQNVIFGEDMCITAKMIQEGYSIAYTGNASVYHSHNYTPWEEFKRYFDIGVLHSSNKWIQKKFGKTNGEGIRYVKSELKYTKKYGIFWVIKALISSTSKYVGYKFGYFNFFLPYNVKIKMSMNKNYWN